MTGTGIKTKTLGYFKGGTNRNALLFIFILLAGKIVGDISDAERRNVCRKFTADTKLQNLIASGRRGAEPCPCIEQKIKLDDTFEKIENCYRQWFYREGAKQICCYSEIGNLILEGPGAGYLLVEGKEEAIENAHRHCCGNISPKLSCQSFYEINPPDNCRAYVPPSVVTSSGDPRIETIDGKSYFFNGHGEYVFLKDSKNFEIQARTDYVIKGNNDSTMFTAFAFFHKTSSEQIELHYDRESKDIRFYRNGTYKENCNASTTGGKGHTYPCEGGERHRCSILAGDGKIIVQGCGLGNYAKQLTFQSQSFMRIEISRGKDNNTVNILGLAGHGKGGYSMRNGSRVNTTSPQKMFEFGESWSLQNLSESHFKYASTGGNFTFYNKHHSRPKFLEDLVGNLSALFANFTSENIIRFNNTCRNYWNHEPNKQCLLTIARTGDYDLGVEEMKEANSTHRKLMIINNRPPQFKENTTKNATVKYGGTWTFNLSKYVEDDQNDTLVYTVDTKIPQTEFNLTKDGFFTWTVGEGLRKIDTSIIFRVNDTFNATAVQEIKIVYCGCENSSDCNFEFPLPSKLNSSGDIIRASCVCQIYHSGVFCENQTNPCDGVKCFASCNAAIPKTGDFWPCAKCPKGLKDVGIISVDQKCPDLDECAAGYEADDKCEQNCTNTDGSFVCSCRSGYQLHSNGYKCEDIDECNRNLKYCGKTEICVNTIGDATCECAPGYTRKVKGAVCTEVEINECNHTDKYHCTGPADSATCKDTTGGWQCECKDGYSAKNSTYYDRVCEDIDECKYGYHTCDNGGTCNNNVGNWTCICPPGYEPYVLDKHNISYINECENPKSCVDGYCTNRNGTFDCVYPPGYTNGSANIGATHINYTGKLEHSIDVKCIGSNWNISMNMDMLKILYPKIRSHDIYLGDRTCQGKQEGSVLKFNFDISTCKTTEKTSGITHVFSNKLFYVIFDPIIPFLIRRHIWTFAVECDYIKSGTGTSHLHHAIELHHATYVKHYNVTVQLFSDQNFQYPINEDIGTVRVGEDVYVKVSTTIPDWNTKMRLHTCFTRPNNNATSDMDVVLINNGCEVDDNTHIISQSTHETRFVFQDFEYLTNDEGLDVNCNATFCDSKDYSPDCVQTCYQSPSLIG